MMVGVHVDQTFLTDCVASFMGNGERRYQQDHRTFQDVVSVIGPLFVGATLQFVCSINASMHGL